MATGRSVWLPDLDDVSRGFLSRLDYRGLGGIEFKSTGAERCFIEMSVRPEGFHQLAIHAGYDLPWAAYCDEVLGHVPTCAARPRDTYWMYGTAYLYQMLSARRGVGVLWEFARIVLSGRCRFAVFSCDDPLPWTRLIRMQVSRAARRLMAVAKRWFS